MKFEIYFIHNTFKRKKYIIKKYCIHLHSPLTENLTRLE